jgi:hypothetical protein
MLDWSTFDALPSTIHAQNILEHRLLVQIWRNMRENPHLI